MTQLEPARLQEFQLIGSIGSGSTARVFDAVHTATQRPVAIKMLEPSAKGTEISERFAREAIALAGVTSRHVGRILGYGFDRGQPFLVLERLQGETLDAKYRRDGPLSLWLASDWIAQLICAVRDIHDANIVHRDIKPGNIFLDTTSGQVTVKLIDFGVARLLELTGGGQGLTSTNHLIGSMGYMAPEQFTAARSVGFTADVYAVGVVCFRVLTGKLPFASRSLETLLKMKCEQHPPALSGVEGAPKLDALDWFVSVALARNAAHRFQTAREMLEGWGTVRNAIARFYEEDSQTSVDALSNMEASSTLVERKPASVRAGGPHDADGAPAEANWDEALETRRFGTGDATILAPLAPGAPAGRAAAVAPGPRPAAIAPAPVAPGAAGPAAPLSPRAGGVPLPPRRPHAASPHPSANHAPPLPPSPASSASEESRSSSEVSSGSGQTLRMKSPINPRAAAVAKLPSYATMDIDVPTETNRDNLKALVDREIEAARRKK